MIIRKLQAAPHTADAEATQDQKRSVMECPEAHWAWRLRVPLLGRPGYDDAVLRTA
jgi:hypothetical protein